MKIDNEDISSFIRYYLEKHEEEKKEFRPGIDEIPVSGVQISSKNIADVIDTVLSGWFTEGERCEQFSKEITKYFNKSPTLVTLCNSI